MNSIANLKTLQFDSPDGPIPVIVVGLNIEEPENLDAFILEVVERFKLQRMCSPPTTSSLLITILSPMPVDRFVTQWKRVANQDKVLAFFMSQMRKADVLRGVETGVTLEAASLV